VLGSDRQTSSSPLPLVRIMYCKFEEAFTCLLWGSYHGKRIHMLPFRMVIGWFIIFIYMVEGMKLIAINVAEDSRVKFYLAEVHFSNTVVQYYFNTAMCLCFFGSAWVSFRYYLLNKYGGHHFSFCDLYFRHPQLVQSVLDLPEVTFYKQLKIARQFYRIGTVIKNFFWLFFVTPTLLNARTSYDILGTSQSHSILTLVCSINSSFFLSYRAP
jgi:hypothetical protein